MSVYQLSAPGPVSVPTHDARSRLIPLTEPYILHKATCSAVSPNPSHSPTHPSLHHPPSRAHTHFTTTQPTPAVLHYYDRDLARASFPHVSRCCPLAFGSLPPSPPLLFVRQVSLITLLRATVATWSGCIMTCIYARLFTVAGIFYSRSDGTRRGRGWVYVVDGGCG